MSNTDQTPSDQEPQGDPQAGAQQEGAPETADQADDAPADAAPATDNDAQAEQAAEDNDTAEAGNTTPEAESSAKSGNAGRTALGVGAGAAVVALVAGTILNNMAVRDGNEDMRDGFAGVATELETVQTNLTALGSDVAEIRTILEETVHPLRDSAYHFTQGTLSDVTFGLGRTDVSSDYAEQFGHLANAYRLNPTEFCVQITGHASEIGSAATNKELAEQRAWNVADTLQASFNIPADGFIVNSHGEDQPQGVRLSALDQRVELSACPSKP